MNGVIYKVHMMNGEVRDFPGSYWDIQREISYVEFRRTQYPREWKCIPWHQIKEIETK